MALDVGAQAAMRAGIGPSDAEVVRRVRAGEVELFELLMRRHNTRVYRAVRAILRDEAAAEDAMQQAYLQAYAALGAFSGASSFSTWLVRIAVNEALLRLRKDRRLVPVDEVPESAEEEATTMPSRDDPEQRVAAREAVQILEQALDRLPLPYRTVVMLRNVDQMSTAETASALGVTEVTVKVRLHRARLALRNLVADEVGEAAPDAYPFLAPRCDRVVAAVMRAIGAQVG